ncbi:MAG: TonB-dependent receptor domain-containing protein [Opitutales bacterium]
MMAVLGIPAGAVDRPSEALFELAPYRVVATRTALSEARIPASVTGLAQADLEHLAVADAGELIQFEPLVELPFDVGGGDAFVPYQSPGYSAFAIRGVGGNRVLVQIDGIRQPEIMTGGGGTRTDLFDPWLLSSLEILKGTGSSLYGSDALGGVVALSTRGATSAAGTALQFGARYNGASDERALLGVGSVVAGDWSARVGHVDRDGHERANYGEVEENPETRQSAHSLAALGWSSRDHEVSLTLERFRRDETYALDSAEGFQPALFLDITEVAFASEQVRERASLDYAWRPRKSTWLDAVTLLAYRQEATTDALNRQVAVAPNPSFGDGRDRTDTITFRQEARGLEAVATARATSGAIAHRITAGALLERNEMASGFVRLDRLPEEVETDLIGMAPSDTRRDALFLQNEMEWGDWLLVGGLRGEHYAIEPQDSAAYVNRLNERLPPGFPALRPVDYALTTWAPSVSLARFWTTELMTYGRFSRGYRQPTAEEFTGLFYHGAEFVILPNPELREETSDGWELGLKWFNERVQLQAAVFLTDYAGFIETVDTGERLEPGNPRSLRIQQARNLEAARIHGFEVSARWQLLSPGATEPTRLHLLTTLGKAWGEDRQTGAPLASVSPLKAVAALGWEATSGRWATTLSATYRAEHHDPPEQTRFVPEASLVLDWFGQWRVNDYLLLQAGVGNLLDERYHLWSHSNQGIHFADQPERSTLPGRYLHAGVRVRF